MVMELTEDQVSEFIKEGKSVIRTWDEGCGYCVKYEPIFNEYVSENNTKFGILRLYVLKDKKPSSFKRAYMKQDTSDNIKETVPGTFVFENGELKARHFGAMTKEQLKDLVEKYQAPVQVQQPQTIEQVIARSSNVELESFAYRAIMNIENLRKELALIQEALSKRQQPQKAV